MDNQSKNTSDNSNARDITTNRTEQHSSVPNDLPTSKHDEDRLQPEETIINMPDVTDIPGQENVSVPPLGEMADTTMSSADEEGNDIFGQDAENLGMRMGTDADVKPKERRALDDDRYMPTRDEDNLRRATQGNTDFQGEELNERSFGDERSGPNMDIPDSESDVLNPFIIKENKPNTDYQTGSGEGENAGQSKE